MLLTRGEKGNLSLQNRLRGPIAVFEHILISRIMETDVSTLLMKIVDALQPH